MYLQLYKDWAMMVEEDSSLTVERALAYGLHPAVRQVSRESCELFAGELRTLASLALYEIKEKNR